MGPLFCSRQTEYHGYVTRRQPHNPGGEVLFDTSSMVEEPARRLTPGPQVRSTDAEYMLSEQRAYAIPFVTASRWRGSIDWLFDRPFEGSDQDFEVAQFLPLLPVRGTTTARMYAPGFNEYTSNYDTNLDRSIAVARSIDDFDEPPHYYIEELWRKDSLRLLYHLRENRLSVAELTVQLSMENVVQYVVKDILQETDVMMFDDAVRQLRNARRKRNQFNNGMRGGMHFVHPLFRHKSRAERIQACTGEGSAESFKAFIEEENRKQDARRVALKLLRGNVVVEAKDQPYGPDDIWLGQVA